MSRPKKKKQREYSYVKTFMRFLLIFLLFLVDLAIILVGSYVLNQYTVYLYAFIELLSIIVMIPLISSDRNAAYKLYWLGVALVLPIAGHIMYLFWGRSVINRKAHREIQRAIDKANENQIMDYALVEKLSKENADKGKIATYLYNQNYPLYENTAITYFEVGERFFEDVEEKLKSATKYVFISFFIIADGSIWERYTKILEEKLNQGVKIYIMFDDTGSFMQMSDTSIKELKAKGFKVLIFNPVEKSYHRLFFNYRNHQKILVVDGKYAYTGGINISDRYANIVSPYGHWKDTGLRLEGDAIYGMQLIFIGMWNASGGHMNINNFKIPKQIVPNGTYCQPFADGPSNNPNNPAIDMFMHIISNAGERVNIMTPYLILDDTMQDVLSLTAKSGVKVRIIVPGIPDKKIVHHLTVVHYGPLLRDGVEIYEYTPGFIHAKHCTNESSAIVGTINMDFRSFYTHFENGVWIPDGKVLKDIDDDFEKTIRQCRQVTYEEWQNRPLNQKILQKFLYFFKCHF
ncbi:MAG: cardiolipin synthase [Lachnospiraceae bacterium]|nr:cardiolipin synthase [Lachnospiraceae bacterium]